MNIKPTCSKGEWLTTLIVAFPTYELYRWRRRALRDGNQRAPIDSINLRTITDTALRLSFSTPTQKTIKATTMDLIYVQVTFLNRFLNLHDVIASSHPRTIDWNKPSVQHWASRSLDHREKIPNTNSITASLLPPLRRHDRLTRTIMQHVTTDYKNKSRPCIGHLDYVRRQHLSLTTSKPDIPSVYLDRLFDIKHYDRQYEENTWFIPSLYQAQRNLRVLEINGSRRWKNATSQTSSSR